MNEKDLIYIGDKTYKKAEVIPLSDNKASKNCLCLAPNGKLYTYDDLPEGETFTPQHLYIVDNSEIKEGDWAYLEFYGTIGGLRQEVGKYDITKSYLTKKKIIATTDSSLTIPCNCETVKSAGVCSAPNGYNCDNPLPRPSDDFLSVFCKYKGNIKKVLVEYNIEDDEPIYQGYSFDRTEIIQEAIKTGGNSAVTFTLKVAPDNTITIKPLKEKERTYTKEDMWKAWTSTMEEIPIYELNQLTEEFEEWLSNLQT